MPWSLIGKEEGVMKVWIGCVGLVLVLCASSARAQEKPQMACPDQLFIAKSQMGNYQTDYVRKVQELSQVQYQLAVANQKLKMLEEAAKKVDPKDSESK
jgi:hypothetical protein